MQAVAEEGGALDAAGCTSRATVARQLRDLGYRVCEAESASDALAVLEDSERVDLLFTDMMLPGGVNGKELIVRLDPDGEDEALARPHARPMDFTGRAMRGFITIRPDGLKGGRLNRWVQAAVARAESLPSKLHCAFGIRKLSRLGR